MVDVGDRICGAWTLSLEEFELLFDLLEGF